MTDKDESPIDPPKDPPADPPADPPKDDTPPADPPKADPPPVSEDMPEWGKQLTATVNNLVEALKPPMPNDNEVVEDHTPVREPFHKRPLSEFFGFGK